MTTHAIAALSFLARHDVVRVERAREDCVLPVLSRCEVSLDDRAGIRHRHQRGTAEEESPAHAALRGAVRDGRGGYFERPL